MDLIPPYVAYYSWTGQIECYIGRMLSMAIEPKLSHTAAMILQAIHAGQIYGFSVMEMTGLPSGTVYPAMRRLERDGLIVSKWEQQSIADAEQRPLRKYYRLTRAGQNALEAIHKRYPLLEKLIPSPEVRRV
jgi:PadR family transcriptional regulator PadR